MALKAIEADAYQYLPSCEPYGAILLTFTLLEFVEIEPLLTLIARATEPHGLMILALPDVWQDVLQNEVVSVDTARALLVGSVKLPKIDKFTKTEYPFYARRLELVISCALRVGFVLEQLERGGSDEGAFLLLFRRKADGASGKRDV
jgi:hypothetical protein